VARAHPRHRVLPRAFFCRDTALVARELLGTIIECRGPAGVASGRIVETEAYLGGDDPASHAVVGRTPRNRHLFGRPGIAYVYFIYGRYWCVNAVTERPGGGQAVLVRAIEPLDGIDLMRARRGSVGADRGLTNGPARLCLALGIDGRLNGVSLQRGPLVVREGGEGGAVPDAAVSVSHRIGLTRAADWPLRFFLTDNAHVSRTPSAFSVGRYIAGSGARH
jgi:DNA-3-methyladenine glycosylase